MKGVTIVVSILLGFAVGALVGFIVGLDCERSGFFRRRALRRAARLRAPGASGPASLEPGFMEQGGMAVGDVPGVWAGVDGHYYQAPSLTGPASKGFDRNRPAVIRRLAIDPWGKR